MSTRPIARDRWGARFSREHGYWLLAGEPATQLPFAMRPIPEPLTRETGREALERLVDDFEYWHRSEGRP